MANKSLASSAAVMASGTLVSRILGLVRAAMLAAAIATVGGAADAFSVANKLPTIIYMLIAGGVLNAVLVPQIVRAMQNKADGGHRYVNQLLTLGTTSLAIITGILTAGAGILVTMYAATMSPDWKPLAVTFAYICIPQLFFYGLYTLLGQVLNARGNFGPYMWAPALNNVVSIIGLGVYLYLYGTYQLSSGPEVWDSTRIWLVAGTATAGIAAQALVLIIPLYRSGFRFTPVFTFKDSGLGRATKVAGWAFAALLVGQLGYLIISNLSAAAGAEGVRLGITVAGNATYDHAFAIFMLPQSLITVSLVTAMFTRLSQHAAAREYGSVRDQLSMGLRTLAVFTMFASAALIVLAIPTVAVVLAGTQEWEFQRAIGHVVAAFALGLVPIGAWTMIQRVYFAFEDTRSLFHIQIPMMLIAVSSAAIAYFLFPPTWWVVVGAGLGTTISNTFGALVAYLALRRKLPSLDGSRVLRTHLRLLIAILPPALTTWGLLHLWGVRAGLAGSFLRVAVLGTFMLVFYLVMLRLLQVTELDGLQVRILRMLRPITRRLSPLVNRLPGSAILRRIGTFFAPFESRASAVSSKWTVGQSIGDNYQLISRMTSHTEDHQSLTYWEALDTSGDRTVRLLTLSGAPERVTAALDAARRRKILDDARFPRVLDVFHDGDDGIVVTEPVLGTTLTELIKAHAVSASDVRSIVGEVAVAMERVRHLGYQHLALTPDSIWIHDRAVTIVGLGIDAALTGITAKSSDHGARKDTIALAHILLAGLSGTWVGTRSVNLPRRSAIFTSAENLHDMAPEAPLDLIRLVFITGSPFEHGPHTPQEFADNLRPWDPIPRIDGPEFIAEDFVTGEFLAVGAAAPEPDDEPAPSVVASESPESRRHHRGVSETIPPAASIVAAPTGWDLTEDAPEATLRRAPAPKPQVPEHGDSPFGPAPQRQFTPVAPPEPAPEPTTPLFAPARAGSSPHDRFREVTSNVVDQFRPIEGEKQKRFNPSGFVLLTMLALLIFAIVLASSSLRDAWNWEPEPGPTQTAPAFAPTEAPEEPEGGAAPPEGDPDDEPAPKKIVIAEAITYDPSTGGGENQDIAARGIDGNPETFWRSLRYQNPKYGIKAGLAYSVVLEEESPVSEVIVHMRGKGGKVEIRAGDPRNPTTGELLGSGPLDGATTFTFDKPVSTDTIVLWFPELPRADSDGMNRIELAEVTLK